MHDLIQLHNIPSELITKASFELIFTILLNGILTKQPIIISHKKIGKATTVLDHKNKIDLNGKIRKKQKQIRF